MFTELVGNLAREELCFGYTCDLYVVTPGFQIRIAVYSLKTVITEAELNEAGEIVKAEVAILWGTWLQTIIDFLIIAFCIFCVVRMITKIREKANEKEALAKAEADAAAAKAHEHANSAELAKIADGDVAKWNAAEGNPKTYADGLNATMQGVVNGIDSRVGTLESTIVDKAEADDLDAAVARIAANETAIAANTSAINSFTPITSDEVAALFA